MLMKFKPPPLPAIESARARLVITVTASLPAIRIVVMGSWQAQSSVMTTTLTMGTDVQIHVYLQPVAMGVRTPMKPMWIVVATPVHPVHLVVDVLMRRTVPKAFVQMVYANLHCVAICKLMRTMVRPASTVVVPIVHRVSLGLTATWPQTVRVLIAVSVVRVSSLPVMMASRMAVRVMKTVVVIVKTHA
jgi:hypothetical protein